MSMREFIKQNRAEIDRVIKGICPNCRLDDGERRAWIENDESLYNWARSEGVKT